ncbi:hypothetical protein E2C01_059114 [Portunus trituberculatus]|uniref:Uncharacterized protein n=1 Tax=Portunus trituberculatus TaxID=210409 RepID=A0A5B7GX85_PORTR|nr:hypothetical protein [Portunus trituberculatus]
MLASNYLRFRELPSTICQMWSTFIRSAFVSSPSQQSFHTQPITTPHSLTFYHTTSRLTRHSNSPFL